MYLIPLNYGGTFAWLHFFVYFCEKNKWVKYPSNHKKKDGAKFPQAINAMNVGTCLGHVYNASAQWHFLPPPH